MVNFFSRVLIATVPLLCGPFAAAQELEDPSVASNPGPDAPATLFPHSNQSRWWISGQINTILQGHPAFAAKYTGANSLKPEAEIRNSRVFTLYLGFEVTRAMEVFADVESAGGQGLSGALGITSLTDADVIRNSGLGAAPYLARIFIRQIIPLSRDRVKEERGPLAVHARVPARRLEIRLGKFALPDTFDANSVGSDDHLQFFNLSAISNASWQYAADSRGYTYGLALEYADRSYNFRFAEALMTTVPNGIELDWDLRRAHAENAEFELRPRLLKKRPTAIRFLGCINHANSGSYSEAIKSYVKKITARPMVELTRQQGHIKYGFGANVEQELPKGFRAFARFAWDDSRFESFEVTQNIDFGIDCSGSRWHRSRDKIGATVLSNGLARNVQEYLALGGRGILLGDGALRYGRENVIESYYNMHLWRGLYGAVDLQHIWNPGYNQDRGPVWVPGLRLHLQL